MSDELRALLERHCPGDSASTPLARLNISRTGLSTEPVSSARYPRLCIVAQGRKRVFLGGEAFFFDPTRFLLTSVNLPTTSEIMQPPYLGVSLTLDQAVLASLLLEMPTGGSDDDGEAPCCQPLVAVPVDGDLLEAVLHLVRLLDQPQHLPVLAPLAERELLYRLLVGPAGRVLQAWLRPTSRAAQIGRVTRLLRRQYKQPVRIEALARLAGMSTPTFHRHFRAVTTMSPLQFQKCIRLQEARRLLLTREQGAADVAFAVGYASRHQFSREYHRMFGVPPGQASQSGKNGVHSGPRAEGMRVPMTEHGPLGGRQPVAESEVRLGSPHDGVIVCGSKAQRQAPVWPPKTSSSAGQRDSPPVPLAAARNRTRNHGAHRRSRAA